MKVKVSASRLNLMSAPITDNNLLQYAEDHNHRLTNSNIDGKYSSMIESISRAYYDFLTTTQKKEKTNDEVLEYSTQVKDLVLELKKVIRKLEGNARASLTKGSDLYLTIFPKGLTEYNRLTNTNVDKLMVRVESFITHNPTVFINKLVTEFEETYDDYKLKRKQYLVQKRKCEKLTSDKKLFKDALKRQLQINFHKLSLEFIEKPEKAMSFYNPKLLATKKTRRRKNKGNRNSICI